MFSKNFLKERIIKDGIVKAGNVLKVDSFLNHQMDISLMEEIGREFKRRFGDKKVTKVINRVIIATGAAVLILAGIFPAFGAVLVTLPEAVLGGCTIMMFGNIVISGLQMIGSCGFTQFPEMFNIFPDIIRTIFDENCVAVVFIAAIIMNLIMPKKGES